MCISNLIFLYIIPYLDALTNTLGLWWRIVRRVYSLFSIMVILLLIFYLVAFVFLKVLFALSVAENK